jgi:hypothetical protein
MNSTTLEVFFCAPPQPHLTQAHTLAPVEPTPPNLCHTALDHCRCESRLLVRIGESI